MKTTRPRRSHRHLRRNRMMNRKTERDYLQEADQLEASGQLDDSLAVYSRGIASFPDSAWLFARYGRCCLILKRYREAVAHFSRAIELQPDASTTLFFRAEAYEGIGALDSALDDYVRSAGLKPKADVYVNIGLIHKFRSENNLASEAFRKALDLDPESAIARNLLKQIDSGAHETVN